MFSNGSPGQNIWVHKFLPRSAENCVSEVDPRLEKKNGNADYLNLLKSTSLICVNDVACNANFPLASYLTPHTLPVVLIRVTSCDGCLQKESSPEPDLKNGPTSPPEHEPPVLPHAKSVDSTSPRSLRRHEPAAGMCCHLFGQNYTRSTGKCRFKGCDDVAAVVYC